ncbi:MAG: hypothetical protein VYB09_07340 [Planctomycetota bacterium]|nr:hypothetical protein [Planctomycetota bacterium]MEE2991406.1 hypothetical protein [Planctomycetota bacterium]
MFTIAPGNTRVFWILLLALCACLPAAASADDIEASILWQTDVEKAQQLGARHNRLILLHFWSRDCPNCEELEQGAFRDPSFVTALHTTYIPVKINVDKFPQLRRRYRIRRRPTDVVITASGEELHRGLSRRATGQYQNLLSAIAQRHRGTRQQLSPVLHNPVTRVAQLESDEPGRETPAVNPEVELVPPRVTYGVPFNPAAQQAPLTAPAERQPARVTTVPSSEPEEGQWRPVLSRPPSSTAGSPDFTPRWVEAPRPQAASPPGELPSELAPAIVKEASRQATISPVIETEQVLPPKLPRHTFANTRLGLGGYCPVTLLGTPQQAGNWVIGDRRWGVVHRDRLYLFAAAAQRDLFLQDPDRYSPVISGYDPVQLTEHRQLVDGRREYGVTYRGRIYLFASEATLHRFYQSPGKYESTVEIAMQSARQRQHHSIATKPADE